MCKLPVALVALALAVALIPACGDDAKSCDAKPKTGEECGGQSDVCAYSRSASEVMACSCTGGKWLCEALQCPAAAPATGDPCSDFVDGARCEYAASVCSCEAGDAGSLSWRCE